MDVIIGIVVVVFGIMQLILFFKLWDMTKDVKRIREFLIKDSIDWADKVTNAEKIGAMPLINKLMSDEVIVKNISTNKMEMWSTNFWESKQDNSDIKLIYRPTLRA